MHRDIKGSNILVTKEGVVKIADLGLARDFKRVNTKNFTYRVVTRWYRAPELLLAICEYSQSIDIWSVGCFVAEMFLGKPLFMSSSESEQLPLIMERLGAPTEETWPNMAKYLKNNQYLTDANAVYKKKEKADPKFGKLRLQEYLDDFAARVRANDGIGSVWAKMIDAKAIDLIVKMLMLDPGKRLTAEEALRHPYFTEEPLPCDLEKMPEISGEYKELGTR